MARLLRTRTPSPLPKQSTRSSPRLPAAERQKRLEDGARKEGRLTLIHTMRGSLSINHVALFQKRYPFLNVSLEGDIGSQDAAERLYAEETAGRHLTDLINVALPDLTALIGRNMIARFTTPAIDKVLPPYKGFIDQEGRWTPWYWSEHGISYNSQAGAKGQGPDGVDGSVQSVLQGQRVVRSGRGALSIGPLRHHGRGGDR